MEHPPSTSCTAATVPRLVEVLALVDGPRLVEVPARPWQDPFADEPSQSTRVGPRFGSEGICRPLTWAFAPGGG